MLHSTGATPKGVLKLMKIEKFSQRHLSPLGIFYFFNEPVRPALVNLRWS